LAFPLTYGHGGHQGHGGHGALCGRGGGGVPTPDDWLQQCDAPAWQRSGSEAARCPSDERG
jgi:hypothetical protein